MVVDYTLIPVAGLAVTVGGTVQSGVGLGFNLIASPIVALIEPSLMPGVMLVTGLVLAVIVAAREWRHILWHGSYWIAGGMVAGTGAGLIVISVVPPEALGAATALMVLAAVGVTMAGAQLPRNGWTLIAAGVFSGAAATSTSLGGPPIALMYQQERGAAVRSTLGMYFCIGYSLALASLAISGHLPRTAIFTGLALAPFAAIGSLLSLPLRRYLDSGRTRTAVLSVISVSALILLAHSVVSYA